VELGDDVVPDETTILRFRHLMEKHQLSGAIFDAIGGLLEARGLLLRSGTIVDATIIAAPSSTKNATATRDPEMKQARKGRNWHFGMKLHIGTDQRGIVHTMRATDAAVTNITQLPHSCMGKSARSSVTRRIGSKTIDSSLSRGDTLSDQSAAQPPTTVERALAYDQPGAYPRVRLAHLSRD
jgi:hypothetical protein